MIGPGSIVTICKQQTGNHGNLRITNGKCDNNSGSKDNKNDMLHTPVLLPPPLCGANSFCTKAGTCSSTVKLHVLACEHTHCCRPLYTHLTTQDSGIVHPTCQHSPSLFTSLPSCQQILPFRSIAAIGGTAIPRQSTYTSAQHSACVQSLQAILENGLNLFRHAVGGAIKIHGGATFLRPPTSPFKLQQTADIFTMLHFAAKAKST